jgi:hypothetical protein
MYMSDGKGQYVNIKIACGKHKGIFREILSVPRNIVMDLNNVMKDRPSDLYAYYYSNIIVRPQIHFCIWYMQVKNIAVKDLVDSSTYYYYAWLWRVVARFVHNRETNFVVKKALHFSNTQAPTGPIS